MDGNSVSDSLATAEVEAPARPVIVVVCNRKGGVAKSTTASNLAVTLAAFGYDTVLVDLDPQADSTRAMRQAEAGRGSFDLVLGEATLLDVGLRTPFEGLALVPATPALALADVDAASLRCDAGSLRGRLGTPDSSPDFAIFDCPPYLGAASVTAMAAADMALIPVAPTPSAAEGLSGTWTTLTQLKRALGSGSAVLLIGADTDDPVSTVMAERIRQNFGDALLSAVIPPDSTVEEAAFHGLPVVVWDHKAPSSARYLEVAMEVLERLHQRPGIGPLRHPRKLSDTVERLQSWRRALAPPQEALAMLARASTPPPASVEAAPPAAVAEALAPAAAGAAREIRIFGRRFAFRMPDLNIALPSLKGGGRDAVGPVLSKLKLSLGGGGKGGRGKKAKSRPLVMLAPVVLAAGALVLYMVMSPDAAEILEILMEGL